MPIGESIRAARKKAGLTQAELGKKLGVSGSMIGQWENSLRKPKTETLLNIANALNLGYRFDKTGELHFYEFRDLQDGSISDEQLQAIKAWANNKQKTRLLAAFDQLNDAGRRIALEQIETLIKQIELQRVSASEE